MLQEIREKNKQDLQNLALGINKYNNSFVSQTKPQKSAQLITFGNNKGIPILIIPSLINRANILNLNDENSFCKELVNAGFAPYLVDWGEPDEFAKTQDIMGYIKNILLPLIKPLPKKFIVAGYCMGGFMGLLLEKIIPERVLGYVTLATPWDFSNNKIPMINLNTEVISGAHIQMLFYLSAPFDVNRKFIGFQEGKFLDKEFIEIEHWVNDTQDLSAPVFFECIEQFYQNNALFNKKWHGLDVSKINKPSLVILGKKDNLVPYSSGVALHNQLSNSTLFCLESGHIGLILNRKKITIEAMKAWSGDFKR